MRKLTKFPPQIRERAVRMVFGAEDAYLSLRAAIESIASKIGGTGEALRKRVHQGERGSGVRPGSMTAERPRIQACPCPARDGLS